MLVDPLVSIILPVFNSEEYVYDTIKSIIDQTYKNWELIIVDDNSTDLSFEICKKLSQTDKRIKLVKLNSNSGGPAKPRNLALKISKGEYIAFIDSDDLWHQEKLRIQLKLMIRKNIIFSFSSVFFFQEVLPNNFRSLKIKSFNFKKYSFKQMLMKNKITSCSTSIIKKTNCLIPQFDELKCYSAVEDYIFWLDFLKLNKEYVYKIKIPLTAYRIRKKSLSSIKTKMLKKIIVIFLNKKYFPILFLPYYITTYTIISLVKYFNISLKKYS